jgi:hypothetical protein
VLPASILQCVPCVRDVVADVVADSGNPVYELGILKDVERMSRGLSGHAVVGAQPGDRGRCLAGCQFSRGDAPGQQCGDAEYALGSAWYPSPLVVAACSSRTRIIATIILD